MFYTLSLTFSLSHLCFVVVETVVHVSHTKNCKLPSFRKQKNLSGWTSWELLQFFHTENKCTSLLCEQSKKHKSVAHSRIRFVFSFHNGNTKSVFRKRNEWNMYWKKQKIMSKFMLNKNERTLFKEIEIERFIFVNWKLYIRL